MKTKHLLGLLATSLLATPLLAACATPSAPATAPLFERVPLEQSGDAGVHTYRIPAMAVANDGTVIVAFDARNDSSGDLPGDIDIMVRRSSDLGRSWSPAQRVADFDGGYGAGDASLLADDATGRVFLFYGYGPPGVGLFQSNADRDPASVRTTHPHVMWSDNGGRSWQGPRNLIADIKPEGARGLFATSGHGIQLSQHSPAPGRYSPPHAGAAERCAAMRFVATEGSPNSPHRATVSGQVLHKLFSVVIGPAGDGPSLCMAAA